MKLVLCALFLFSTSAFSSSDIYKCKDPHGRTTYSQIPCSEGAKKLSLSDNTADYSYERNTAQAQAEKLAATEQAEKIAKKQTAASRSYSIPAPPPRPTIITSCDPGGCWDNQGTRYNRGAGNTYITPRGACQMSGGMMHCL